MSVRDFSRDMTIDETIPRAKREKSVTFARIIGMYIHFVYRFRVLSSSGSRDFDVQTTHQR